MTHSRTFRWLAAGLLSLTAATLPLAGCEEKNPDGTPTKAGEAKQAISQATQATKEAAIKSAEAIKEGAGAAAETVKETAERAAEKTREVVNETATRVAAATSGSERKYTLGVIAKSQGNPVFQAARTGAMDAGRELGEKMGVRIDVIWRTPNNEDAQQQAQFIEQLVSAGVDGIAVSCSDAKVLTTAINSAVDKGVQVVTFDSDAPESKRFAYYGINDVDAGRAVARELIKVMGDTGTVAILAGNQNAPNLQARVRGVREELGKHPGVKIKDTYYHAETAPEAARTVQQVQNANPDISGWAMVGGWPLFTENALDGVYDKAKVASVDTLPQQLEYVRKGQVQVLVGQDCYGWGYESVRLLINKIHSNKAPENEINHFDLAIVTRENVEEYAGLWDKWLGKK
ncbi:MAG: substrate-binding domain-containing protein [Phycisphaeraceae bacterium]|nr:substrate-binding domain-containing protein [Phycisphaeraceae bacterium]